MPRYRGELIDTRGRLMSWANVVARLRCRPSDVPDDDNRVTFSQNGSSVATKVDSWPTTSTEGTLFPVYPAVMVNPRWSPEISFRSWFLTACKTGCSSLEALQDIRERPLKQDSDDFQVSPEQQGHSGPWLHVKRNMQLARCLHSSKFLPHRIRLYSLTRTGTCPGLLVC